eukprot:Skav231341  [mRNA]  locus=scaffold2490:153797:162566:- [translate_table: standard]
MTSMLMAAFLTSVNAVAKIVLLCAAGAYLQKAGILHKGCRQEVREGVAKMFVNLLLPCLLFTRTARILPIISLETLPKLAWLAVANLTYVSLGLLIGSLSVLVCRPGTPSMRRILRATPAIGHANSIPFMLVGLIVAQESHAGVLIFWMAFFFAVFLMYLIMHSITLWSVGMNVITKKEDQEDPPGDSQPELPSSHSDELPVPAPSRPMLGRLKHRGADRRGPRGFSIFSKLKALIPGCVNKPMATAIFTAVLGFVPGAKHFFVSGPFSTVFSAMLALGTAGPSIILLTVGALFVNDGFPHPSLVGYAPLCALVMGRLIILPACCIALWITLRQHLFFFPSDNALMLVMCLECCTPTAYHDQNAPNSLATSGIRSQELTAGLFYQSLTAIFAIAAWTTFIVYYVV